MRLVFAILAVALISACSTTGSGGGNGKDQMRSSVSVRLPQYGLRATPEQLEALTVTQLVQMDAIMSDRGSFRLEKTNQLRNILNNAGN